MAEKMYIATGRRKTSTAVVKVVFLLTERHLLHTSATDRHLK